MNDPLSTLFGLCILVASGALFVLGAGPVASNTVAGDHEFWESRRKRRHWVSAMLAATGACGIAAGMVGRGTAWAMLWAVAPLFLVVVMFTAVIDAAATQKHFRRRQQQLVKQTQQFVDAAREKSKTPD